jgi:hypothetical protein
MSSAFDSVSFSNKYIDYLFLKSSSKCAKVYLIVSQEFYCKNEQAGRLVTMWDVLGLI